MESLCRTELSRAFGEVPNTGAEVNALRELRTDIWHESSAGWDTVL